jgi:hypothetical protein
MLQENPALLEVIRLDDKGQVLASAHQDVSFREPAYHRATIGLPPER